MVVVVVVVGSSLGRGMKRLVTQRATSLHKPLGEQRMTLGMCLVDPTWWLVELESKKDLEVLC